MKILVALIHNNNYVRNRALRGSLIQLKAFLPSDLKFEFRSIFKQKPLKRLSLRLRLKKILANAKAMSAYQAALDKASKGPSRPWRYLIFMFKYLVLTFVSTTINGLKASREIALTKKHVEAWRMFVNTDCDFLLVLEDDANFILEEREAAKTISSLIDTIEEANKRKADVVLSLGKGFRLSKLGANELIESKAGNIIEIRLPIIDTAAAYLMNRSMALRITSNYKKTAHPEFINADFLFNYLAIRSSDDVDTAAIHLMNPMFDNASLHGGYASSL